MAQIPLVSGGSQPVFTVDQRIAPIPANVQEYGGNIANSTPTPTE